MAAVPRSPTKGEEYKRTARPEGARPAITPPNRPIFRPIHHIFPAVSPILHTFKELIVFMKGTHLGEFEELVLLTIARLVNSAYSVAICDELSGIAGRTV